MNLPDQLFAEVKSMCLEPCIMLICLTLDCMRAQAETRQPSKDFSRKFPELGLSLMGLFWCGITLKSEHANTHEGRKFVLKPFTLQECIAEYSSRSG